MKFLWEYFLNIFSMTLIDWFIFLSGVAILLVGHIVFEEHSMFFTIAFIPFALYTLVRSEYRYRKRRKKLREKLEVPYEEEEY